MFEVARWRDVFEAWEAIGGVSVRGDDIYGRAGVDSAHKVELFHCGRVAVMDDAEAVNP